MADRILKVTQIIRKTDPTSNDFLYEIDDGYNTILLKELAARNLRSKLTKFFTKDNSIYLSAKEKQKKVKAYSAKWLELEQTKLIHREEYEKLEALRYLTKLVKKQEREQRLAVKAS